MSIVVRPFEPRDQGAAGTIDETLNPDLNDIAASYAAGAFLVACEGEAIVGSGALTPQADGVAVVSRMSTTATHRRKGVACSVLSQLVALALKRGCTHAVLGTSVDWADAIAFYRAFGFEEIRRTPTQVLFELVL